MVSNNSPTVPDHRSNDANANGSVVKNQSTTADAATH